MRQAAFAGKLYPATGPALLRELDEAFTGELADLGRVQRKVEEKLKSVLNVRSKIELVEKGTIPRTAGKARKVVDLRDVYSKDQKAKAKS